MRSEVMLFVRDVEASSAWYQRLLGVKSGHGGHEYEMIVDSGGELVLQLHHLEGEEHPGAELQPGTPRGAGVLIYLQVDDIRGVHRQALALNANVVSDPTYIELARHTEFILRDPDGYALAIYTRGRA